jgi:hypothetical protein
VKAGGATPTIVNDLSKVVLTHHNLKSQGRRQRKSSGQAEGISG